MRVSLIGSGNIANVLGKKILHAGHIIHQVQGRNAETAERLADDLSAEYVSEVTDGSDIYIICVADDALQNISSWMKPVNGFVLHTAGSVSIEVLKPVSANYGVLWPVQSIRKETYEVPALPLAIDANTQWNVMKLKGFAQSFGDAVSVAGDEERIKLHLAAVAANNFSNYLFTLVEEYCVAQGLDFRILLPLLRETVNRMETASPAGLQTGPAVRGDLSTIDKHKQLLNEFPELLGVYDFLSEKIKAHYK